MLCSRHGGGRARPRPEQGGEGDAAAGRKINREGTGEISGRPLEKLELAAMGENFSAPRKKGGLCRGAECREQRASHGREGSSQGKSPWLLALLPARGCCAWDKEQGAAGDTLAPWTPGKSFSCWFPWSASCAPRGCRSGRSCCAMEQGGEMAWEKMELAGGG
jgi:hypothetical protein